MRGVVNYAQRKKRSPHDKRCSVPDCDFKIWSRGMCSRHYQRDHHARSNAYRFGGHEGVVHVSVSGWGYVAI
jgi:hypothetical protein